LLEASYQKQNMTFELWHSGAKAKEGHVKLTTPFQALVIKTFYLKEYSFTSGPNLIKCFSAYLSAYSINLTEPGALIL